MKCATGYRKAKSPAEMDVAELAGWINYWAGLAAYAGKAGAPGASTVALARKEEAVLREELKRREAVRDA